MALNKSLSGIFDPVTTRINLSKNYWLSGLNGSSMSFLIQSFFLKHQKSILLIASDKEKAAYWLNDLEALLAGEKILFFPESYRQPYQEEKTTNANIQERTEVLNLVSRENFKGIVVSYPQALNEKVTLKKQLYKNQLYMIKNKLLLCILLALYECSNLDAESIS